jgi:hypothetical protein
MTIMRPPQQGHGWESVFGSPSSLARNWGTFPSQVDPVPAGPDWVQIKHDGYTLIVRRDADRSFVSRMKASSAYSRSSPTRHAVLVGDRINQLRRGASAVSAAQ